ncbi:MAG: discoidin domain-containing protein, partial [Rikenellaceae bacterium]|nr:discoidin domain-containing protein [Rikenellaceae bacterium]
MQDGQPWLPGECDVSIRPGWFYHPREDHQLRSLSHLVALYYRSVGHNSNLLLNFPVALNGKIHPADSARAVEWRRTIDAELATNLLRKAEASADNHRGGSRRYAPDKAVDGKWDTYWATDDSVHHGCITLTLPQKEHINRLLIQEHIPLGQRVISFSVEYLADGKWLPVDTPEKTTTVGYKRILRFPTVETDQMRICFDKSRGPLCINNIEAFCAPVLLEEPAITRDGADRVIITSGDRESAIYYTTDGTTPSASSLRYDPSHPFVMPGKGQVKAVNIDTVTGRQSAVAVKRFDIPASRFTLKGGNREQTRGYKAMFDGNGYTAYYLPAGAKQEVVIDLGGTYRLRGFTYTPDQNRWASGVITRFELYVDNRPVAAGEFSNIKNNPIEQTVTFNPVKGRTVKLVATDLAGGSRAGIGEFSVLTDED